jgi:hypothetical protein
LIDEAELCRHCIRSGAIDRIMEQMEQAGRHSG